MHLGVVHDDGPGFRLSPPRIGLIFTYIHDEVDESHLNVGLPEKTFKAGQCMLLPFENHPSLQVFG